jgi:Fic family protein
LVIFKVVSILRSDATRWGAEALRVPQTARHPNADAANPSHINRKNCGDCLDGAANGGHTRRMKGADQRYIWELNDWPHWVYDRQRLAPLLARVHRAQGHLSGRMHDLGLDLRDQATLRVLTEDVLKTSEIEGVTLNPDTVRSSIARRLGVDIGALAPTDRQVDGVVDMVLDATQRHHEPLTAERLFGWHAALFPTGYSSLTKIRVAQWRDDAQGPMQVVSGAIHRQKVHYEAPPAYRLDAEMLDFLNGFNGDPHHDPVIKAGLAHLWFVTIHPFEDGNGRIARAVGDMALARAEQSPQRYYSLSAQIQRERNDYYDRLEATQKGGLDVTGWLEWFLACLLRAVQGAEETLAQVLAKARFWQHWAGMPMNDRQIKLLNKLLDGFDGKLTSRKWAAIAKCSQDTALRDLTELLERGVLKRSAASGRSTRYELSSLA